MAVHLHAIACSEDLFRLSRALGAERCLQRFLTLAQLHSCRTILEHRGISHAVFDQEFQNLYRKFFKPIPHTISMFYLFNQPWRREDFVESNLPFLQESFLGFFALRPLKQQRLLEGYIAPLPKTPTAERVSFAICTARREVNLLEDPKLPLWVDAFPFMQQDALYACCAHVGLYSIAQYLALKGFCRHVQFEELVNLVREALPPKRDVPTEGVTVAAMAHALKRLGVVPLVYEYGKDSEQPFSPERVIYHYVESGFPVMVGIYPPKGGHVVVVCGHTFDPNIWWVLAQTSYHGLRPSGGPYHCSTTWIPEFLASDDNFGPYLTVPQWYLSAMAAAHKLVVISLVPDSIMLLGEDAEIYAHTLLHNELWLNENAKLPQDSRAKHWATVFWDHFREEDIVLRTFLRKAEDVKAGFARDTWPAELLAKINTLPMPEWVWVTELSVPMLFSQQRQLLGHVITDPTGDARLGDPLYVLGHTPGVFVLRHPDDSTWLWRYSEDGPVKHLMR